MRRRRLAFGHRPRDPLQEAGATRRRGEAAVNDVIARDTAKTFKWVGTRPVRPDGVPKVTGRAQYGADLAMPGMLVGRILRSPHAHARIRSIDISKAAALPGVKAVVTSADFPEQKFDVCRPGTRGAELLAHDAQHHGAREGALRGPCGRGRRGRQQVDRRPCAVIDRGRLRGAAARHRRRRGDEAGCALAVRGHADPRGGKSESAVEYRQAQRVQSRRRQGRLRGGRRGRRDVVQDRAGAPGLYRAAGLRGALRRRRPVRAVELEPGPLRGAQLHRAAAQHEGRRPARLSGRDRRRVRRQDRGLCRAGRRHAGAQVRRSREGRDEPRGRVPRDRPDLGLVDDGEDRRQARRHASPRPRGCSSCRPAHFPARRS